MKKELICNTQYIDYYLQKYNLTKTEFAKKCGLDLKVINQLYNQDKNVNSKCILPIIKVLNISANTFLFLEEFRVKKST